jgi:hypothetical protein
MPQLLVMPINTEFTLTLKMDTVPTSSEKHQTYGAITQPSRELKSNSPLFLSSTPLLMQLLLDVEANTSSPTPNSDADVL